MTARRYNSPSARIDRQGGIEVTTSERSNRTAWRTVAMVALAVLLMLALADGAVAKKRPFKTGTYMGATDDLEPIGFFVKKKKVTGLFVDLPRCPGDPGGDTGGGQSFAGLEAGIEVKKVGSIAFEQGKHKRVGKFEAEHPFGEVDGYIKGKKAEGFGIALEPCERSFEWAAERTGKLPEGV
jgi:hypothetical protein